jgi:hypothetical protein
VTARDPATPWLMARQWPVAYLLRTPSTGRQSPVPDLARKVGFGSGPAAPVCGDLATELSMAQSEFSDGHKPATSGRVPAISADCRLVTLPWAGRLVPGTPSVQPVKGGVRSPPPSQQVPGGWS